MEIKGTMGRAEDNEFILDREAIEARIRDLLEPAARITDISPLGESEDGLKAYGYGRPLCITYEAGGLHKIVLRTMSPDPFGHARRADRIGNMVLSFDTFGCIPEHVQPIEAGILDPRGKLTPLTEGEPYLLTHYVPGKLYADSLQQAVDEDQATTQDRARAIALADYLADLHSKPSTPRQYIRALRDTLGGGEGIFGLCDNYPSDDPIAPPKRLEALEHAALSWRWKLSQMGHRCRRTHGDFHPFNILFRESTDLSVLDCSRGAAGETADDLSCLSINFLFFSLCGRDEFAGALREIWQIFWDRYLERTGDSEVLGLVAPFFAWRSLVLASPTWYPGVAPDIRDRILRFSEKLLGGSVFDPGRVEELL